MRSKHTGRRRKGLLDQESESNPLSGVANLFDVAMVFAVALLIALVMSYHLPEMLDPDASFTVVKNPGEGKDRNINVRLLTSQPQFHCFWVYIPAAIIRPASST